MRVAIVVFSPGGNTQKAAEMLRGEMEKRGFSVQLLILTRNPLLSNRTGLRFFLEREIAAHDVLCVGGPVYAHHLHYTSKNIIKSLPRPTAVWGEFAVPFVTYGTISSGIALMEAETLLRKTGRRPIAGMKLEAYHHLSGLLTIKVGKGLPIEDDRPLIRDLVDRIARIKVARENVNDGLGFDYQSTAGKLMALLVFREKFWQRFIYPKLVFREDRCAVCGDCADACPVQRLAIRDTGLNMSEKPACIHCARCIAARKFGALSFRCDLEKWNKLFTEASRGNGILPSHEQPKSAVYPIAVHRNEGNHDGMRSL